MRRSSASSRSDSSSVENDAPASSGTVLRSTVRRERAGTSTLSCVCAPVVVSNVSVACASASWGLAIASCVRIWSVSTPSARYRRKVPAGVASAVGASVTAAAARSVSAATAADSSAVASMVAGSAEVSVWVAVAVVPLT